MTQNPLHLEVAADNLDAAVEKALAQLNCSRAEAEVEVLQTPFSGFLGLFGKRQARVRVKLHDRGVIARQFTAQLLRLMGLVVDLELVPSAKQFQIRLFSKDSSLLIGRHGRMLDALQGLVGTMTDRHTADRTPVVLNVNGYRERRQAFLSQLAATLSTKVRKTGKSVKTPPLALGERRILYDMFKQDSDLSARSKNHHGDRKIIILQKRIHG